MNVFFGEGWRRREGFGWTLLLLNMDVFFGSSWLPTSSSYKSYESWSENGSDDVKKFERPVSIPYLHMG